MCVITICEDEREMIATYVSSCGLQRQTNKADKGQTSCRITDTSPEHKYSNNKTIQTQTFLVAVDSESD